MRFLVLLVAVPFLLVGCQPGPEEMVEEQLVVEESAGGESDDEFVFEEFSRVATLVLDEPPRRFSVSSATGDILAVTHAEGNETPAVQLIDSASLSLGDSFPLAAKVESPYISAFFSANGSRLALNDYDVAFHFLDLNDSQAVVRFDNDVTRVTWGAFSTDQTRFYFSQNYPQPRVRVLEVATGQEMEPILAGPAVGALFVTPEYLVVSNDDDNRLTDDSVTIVSLSDNKVVSQMLLGDRPFAFAYSTLTNTLFVASIWSSEISALDLNNLELIDQVEVGIFPSTLALSPDGRLLAVSYTLAQVVTILDAQTLEELQRIDVDEIMAEPFFSSDGSRLFISVGSSLHAYE